MKKILFLLAFLITSFGFSQEVIGYFLDNGTLIPIYSGSGSGGDSFSYANPVDNNLIPDGEGIELGSEGQDFESLFTEKSRYKTTTGLYWSFAADSSDDYSFRLNSVGSPSVHSEIYALNSSGEPTNDRDLADKKYVDEQVALVPSSSLHPPQKNLTDGYTVTAADFQNKTAFFYDNTTNISINVGDVAQLGELITIEQYNTGTVTVNFVGVLGDTKTTIDESNPMVVKRLNFTAAVFRIYNGN